MRFLAFDAAAGSLDAISCREVFQHIPLDEPAAWLAKMHRLLRPGGLLLLSTTHATRTTLRTNDLSTRREVDERQFNAFARTPKLNAAGVPVLPVHLWTRSELRAAVLRAGFDQPIEHQPIQPTSPPSFQWLVARKRAGGDAAAESDALRALRTLPSPPASSVPLQSIEMSAMERLRAIHNGTDRSCARKEKQKRP
jgi:SAM-dependent methyltransferase